MTKRRLAVDGILGALSTVGDNHLVHGREPCREQAALPVAVKTIGRTDIIDVRHAILILAIVDNKRQLLWLEAHTIRLFDEHQACGLLAVSHVKLEFGSGKRQCLHIYVKRDMIQCILKHVVVGDGAYHPLNAVVDGNWILQFQQVIVQVFLVQYQAAVFYHIQENHLGGAALHPDAQCVARLLTHQFATLDNRHAVAVGTVFIG